MIQTIRHGKGFFLAGYSLGLCPGRSPFNLRRMITITSSTAQGGGGSFKRKTIGEIGCCESRMSKQKH